MPNTLDNLQKLVDRHRVLYFLVFYGALAVIAVGVGWLFVRAETPILENPIFWWIYFPVLACLFGAGAPPRMLIGKRLVVIALVLLGAWLMFSNVDCSGSGSGDPFDRPPPMSLR